MSRVRFAAVAVAVLVASTALAGCGGDDKAAPPPDDDVIVLTPAKDGGVPHTHTKVIGTGTTSSAGGYRLADVRLPKSTGPGSMQFRILDPDGRPLTDYTEEQTKLLHLYVVRDDLQDFRHLHPVLGDDGTWRAMVDLAQPGRYRVVTEFVPKVRTDGAHVVLDQVVTVPGRWKTTQVPDDTVAGDGVVQVAAPKALAVGSEQSMVLTISDGDDGVLNLGTYLGAYAHLTGFNVETGDFVHAHPLGEPETTSKGSELTFHTTFAKPGRYRFFVQVRVDGFVHTVAVTSTVAAT